MKNKSPRGLRNRSVAHRHEGAAAEDLQLAVVDDQAQRFAGALAEEQPRLAVQVGSRHAGALGNRGRRLRLNCFGGFGIWGGRKLIADAARERRRRRFVRIAQDGDRKALRRKTTQPCTVPGRAAGMRHERAAAVGVHHQATRITELSAVVQLCLFLKLSGDERAQTSARQRVVPDHEVGRRAEDGAAAAAALVADIHSHAPAVALLLVTESAVLDDVPQITRGHGGLHPERLEQSLAREIGKRHPARARDEIRQQHVAAVRIRPFLAGSEVEAALTQSQAHYVIDISPSQCPEPGPVANTGGMSEQMVHRDLLAVIRKFREVFADVVGKGKFSIFDEEQDCRGDELLSYRSDVEDRVRAHWNVALEVGRAVSAVHDQLSVLRDGDRATGRGPAWPS